MRVSDLAKELNVTSEDVLNRLRSIKLKAQDSKQELNSVVVSVLRSEFKKNRPVEPKVSREAAKSEMPSKGKKESVAKPQAKPQAKPEIKAKIKTEKVVKKPTTGKKIPTLKKGEAVVEKKAVKVPGRLKPKIALKSPGKAAVKVAPEPFVTLKPLAKKRKKKFPSGAEVPASPSAITAIPAAVSIPAEPGKPVSTVISGKAELSASAQVSARPPEPIKTEPEEILKPLEVNVPISVKDLSVRLQEKPSVVLKKLMQLGVLVHINQGLGEDIVRKITAEFGFHLTKIKTQEQQLIETHKTEDENPSLLRARAPVVTFMGHVDHGKTSLLDKIRKSNIADSEHGGITQHMAAYSVNYRKGYITFLDTPGHEAFTAMRARGAHITDLIILVVAADEGVMPQTEEAINHARAANVPIVVALNKIDRKNIDIDQVKKQLAAHDLHPEDWGGKTIVVPVSAVTGEGVDHLLEMILLEAELLELKANYDKKATGIVVEAHLSRGRGSVVDLIVQSGTLNEGDIIVAGPYYGRVKAMIDDRERAVKIAGPSMPIEVIGLPGVPEAGEIFYAVEDEKQAKEITTRRQTQLKNDKFSAFQKVTLEDLYSRIKDGTIKELNVVLKADVQGSLEALKDSLGKIPSDEVKIKFIHMAVGEINLSDVILAVASQAIIIGFHVDVESRAKDEAEKHQIDVRLYRIIYDAVNDIKKALEGLLEPKIKKKFASRVEIRQVFKLSKSGIVAGCFVQKGKVHRKDHIDIMRNGEVVYSGVISSLKRFKDDVRDVTEGAECGITIDGFDKIQVGDIIESYELERIARTL
ncbi:MAG: translation initiation factor IF-2 [Candidatus Omnitrophota bacterium]